MGSVFPKHQIAPMPVCPKAPESQRLPKFSKSRGPKESILYMKVYMY